MNIFTLVWGNQVWLTKADETNSDPKNIASICKWVKKHVNYHSSLTYDGIFVLMKYLVEQGLDKTFVTKLVKRAICPDMLHNIQAYNWDKATMTITTHQDKENEKQKRLERAAW